MGRHYLNLWMAHPVKFRYRDAHSEFDLGSTGQIHYPCIYRRNRDYKYLIDFGHEDFIFKEQELKKLSDYV